MLESAGARMLLPVREGLLSSFGEWSGPAGGVFCRLKERKAPPNAEEMLLSGFILMFEPKFLTLSRGLLVDVEEVGVGNVLSLS